MTKHAIQTGTALLDTLYTQKDASSAATRMRAQRKAGLTAESLQLLFIRIGELVERDGHFSIPRLIGKTGDAGESLYNSITPLVRYLSGGRVKERSIAPLIKQIGKENNDQQGPPVKLYALTARGRRLWEQLNG